MNVQTDFTAIANDDRNIEGVRDIVMSSLHTGELTDIFSIVPNIKGGQQIAAAGHLEYITRADAGCANTQLNPDIPAIDQRWDPKRLYVGLKWCHSEFEDTFARWGLANGYDVKDLGQSEMILFLTEMIENAMKADINRIALMSYSTMGDDDILSDEAGKLTSYNMLKRGLIPTLQYFSGISALSDNFVNLVKNEGANDTANLTLDADYARSIYKQITDTVDFDANMIISSHTLFQNYKDEMTSPTVFALQSTKDEIMKGMSGMSYDNVPIYDAKLYDKYRKRDFTVASKRDTPHFALYTNKENLLLGVDSENALTNLRFEYVGGSDEHFYVKANYSLDFKVANPYELKFAV